MFSAFEKIHSDGVMASLTKTQISNSFCFLFSFFTQARSLFGGGGGGAAPEAEEEEEEEPAAEPEEEEEEE